MKKLTLNLDELTVVSFETVVSSRDEGTVQGYDRAWSDESVCPTTGPSERRPCV